MPHSHRSAEALLISLFLVAPAALALETDREQTMQIDADHAKGNAAAGTTLLTGNVRIDQGSLSIRADRAEVEQQDEDIRRVLLDGTPAHLEQEIEQQGRLKADAERIEYLLAEQKVVLSGNVRIERPRGVMTGARIVYSLDTGEMNAGEQGSRVRMMIAPKPKASQPAEAPKS